MNSTTLDERVIAMAKTARASEELILDADELAVDVETFLSTWWDEDPGYSDFATEIDLDPDDPEVKRLTRLYASTWCRIDH